MSGIPMRSSTWRIPANPDRRHNDQATRQSELGQGHRPSARRPELIRDDREVAGAPSASVRIFYFAQRLGAQEQAQQVRAARPAAGLGNVGTQRSLNPPSFFRVVLRIRAKLLPCWKSFWTSCSTP